MSFSELPENHVTENKCESYTGTEKMPVADNGHKTRRQELQNTKATGTRYKATTAQVEVLPADKDTRFEYENTHQQPATGYRIPGCQDARMPGC